MKNDKFTYESEVVVLPQIRRVLGEIPSPNPTGWQKHSKDNKRVNHEMEDVVRRLIAYFKEDRR